MNEQKQNWALVLVLVIGVITAGLVVGAAFMGAAARVADAASR